jgi:hypothetical protein
MRTNTSAKLSGLVFAALYVGHAEAKKLSNVFTPNAAVCVKFDTDGNPNGAIIDGKSRNHRLNQQMLKLLQGGTWWGKNYSGTNGRWVALSVAPNGYPVPEMLPSCPER